MENNSYGLRKFDDTTANLQLAPEPQTKPLHESRTMVNGIKLKIRLNNSRNIRRYELNCDQLLDINHTQN